MGAGRAGAQGTRELGIGRPVACTRLPPSPSAARNPGPGAYYVKDCYNSRFRSAPGVVIQGVRRPKRHDTGPFCTL